MKIRKIKKHQKKWNGKYSLLTDEGRNVGGDYTGVGYTLLVSTDSIIFTGEGYQTYFKALCLSYEDSDTLDIYFYKMLDGGYGPIEEAVIPIVKLIKQNQEFYFKSSLTSKKNIEYKVERK